MTLLCFYAFAFIQSSEPEQKTFVSCSSLWGGLNFRFRKRKFSEIVGETFLSEIEA